MQNIKITSLRSGEISKKQDFAIKFNEQGLFPVIVQDYLTGKVLMFAYANQESYEYMLEKGETCFWSRSRGELWHKGETSGDFQKIKDMYWDCDNDTLLVIVEQLGKGACHTGTYSCFGRRDVASPCDSYEYNIFDIIANQIDDRKKNPKEKSYTNYLLDEGIDKVCKKIGEEATETVISAKNNDKDGIIGELADLAYHLQVLMYMQGITPNDIRKKLTERHNKEGNLKTKNKKGEF